MYRLWTLAIVSSGVLLTGQCPAVTSSGQKSIPTRQELVSKAKANSNKKFDILIVGNGVGHFAGAIAFEAARRGLSAVYIENRDFGSFPKIPPALNLKSAQNPLQLLIKIQNTIHKQQSLVTNLLPPNQIRQLPVLHPLYTWNQIVQFWFFSKFFNLYNRIHNPKSFKPILVLNKNETLEQFPALNPKNLKGSLMFHEFQILVNQNRLNLTLAQNASKLGALILNHVEFQKLIQNDSGQIIGAQLRDQFTEDLWEIQTKVIVFMNASETKVSNISRILLPDFYCPRNVGLDFEIPKIGNVQLKPYNKWTVLESSVSSKNENLDRLLNDISKFFNSDIKFRKSDILDQEFVETNFFHKQLMEPVNQLNPKSQEDFVQKDRCHTFDSIYLDIPQGSPEFLEPHIFDSTSSVITLQIPTTEFWNIGTLSKEFIDDLINSNPGLFQLEAPLTLEPELLTPLFPLKLIQGHGLAPEVANHLSQTYGTRSVEIAKQAALTCSAWPLVGIRLHPQLPYIEAEVRYAVQQEWACTIEDILSRMDQIMWIQDLEEKEKVIERIGQIVQEELKRIN